VQIRPPASCSRPGRPVLVNRDLRFASCVDWKRGLEWAAVSIVVADWPHRGNAV